VSLVKTSIAYGAATIVRVVAAIGLNKVLAVYVGPAGYALVGQFANIVALATSASGSSVGTGVTKYTAEYFDDEARQTAIWRAAARCITIGCAVLATVLLVASEFVAQWLLGDGGLSTVVVALALTLLPIGLNNLLLAVMNGRKAVRAFVIQNVATSITAAALSWMLAAQYGLTGALLALSLNQALMFLVTMWLCRREPWMSWQSFVGPTDKASVRAVLMFALMTLTSAAVLPVGQMLVRSQLIDNLGETVAGQWQAVFKISEIYLMLFTSTLSVYYLPRLAEIRSRSAMWAEIRKVYAFVLPLCIAAAGAMYVTRHWIAAHLFSRDFVGMVDLFAWQLTGDVIKIGSWVLSFVLVGRAMTRWFILTEIVFTASWVVLTSLLLGVVGRQAAVMAFACNYVLYWAFIAWLVKRELGRSLE
jgi:polysaccharide transporter, PST family